MEVLKRKILLENSIDRNYDSPNWGVITASTFFINVFLTQNIDDMGLFTTQEFIPKDKTSTPADYTVLIDKLQSLGVVFPFMLGSQPQALTNLTPTERNLLRLTGTVESDYYNYGNLSITGVTDSKIDDVKSYDETNPYIINFSINSETYVNYKNIEVNGVDMVKSISDPKVYVFDTQNDNNLGTDSQTTGILYKDFSQPLRTTFKITSEGLNETNTSLSAITKEEYLFGIISSPEVESGVFIDRGETSVLDLHLRLSEIGNISDLTRYGNGFYKINQQ